MDRIEIKSMAKEQIRGKVGILFIISLLIGIISFIGSTVLSYIPLVGVVASGIFISAPLTFSSIIIYLNLTRGIKPEAKDAFSGYRDFWGAFKISFLTGLFTFLWSLLLIIPGIIKSFSYAMSYYILAENPGMGALEAITYSKEIMDGHKTDYFVLCLSFTGWIFLVALTFGIAAIWVVPYMNATFANFYNSIKPSDAIGSYADTVVQ